MSIITLPKIYNKGKDIIMKFVIKVFGWNKKLFEENYQYIIFL